MKNTTNTNFDTALAIGDVSKIVGIPEHTIRFWEKEFKDFLTPARTKGRQRRYFDNDITMLNKIKELLKVQEFSIKGAKKMLNKSISVFENQQKPNSEIDNTQTSALAQQIAELITTQLTTAQVA